MADAIGKTWRSHTPGASWSTYDLNGRAIDAAREQIIPISRLRALLEGAPEARQCGEIVVRLNGHELGRLFVPLVRRGYEMAIAEQQAQEYRRALSEAARG